MRYQITVTGEQPHTNLKKALRHLKTSLHWSKSFFQTRYENENTISVDGEIDFDEVEQNLRFFSTYYGHVFFHLTPVDTTVPPRRVTYRNGEIVTQLPGS